MGGVLFMVLGLILAALVVSTAASPPAEIGSFSGASGINDIIPLIFYFVIAGAGVGMIGIGIYRQVKGN